MTPAATVRYEVFSMPKLSGDLASLFRTGLSRSLSSLLIKLATAGLTYVTFVVLSRMMTGTEYGNFAFGLALATVLAIAAGLGQQTAILRFWQEEQAKGHPARALTALGAGGTITILGSLAVGAGLVLAALALTALDPGTAPAWHLIAAAVLVLPLALAEYNSSALRAQGSVWTALAPRDIVWRIALPGAALLLWWSGMALSGWGALLLAAALLLLALALQQGAASARGYRLAPALAGTSAYWRERGSASRWFLAGGFINALALNVDTIIVGTLLDPQSAGAYFNAFRTAGLMTLFAFAISLVIAPLIARYFHARDLRKAQAVLAMGTGAGFLFALAGFLGLLLFGETIMGFFGDEYRSATPVLLVLALGFVIDAATGPSRTVLMMTGHERRYAAIFGAATLLSILAQLAVLPVFGLMGVAVVNAASRLLAYGVLATWCITRVGLDPTIFGVFRINRIPVAPSGHPAEAQPAE